MNKRGQVFSAVILIPILLILIPIFLLGMGAVVSFFKFLFSPSLNGSIPVWALIGLIIIVLFVFKRRRTNPYVV